MSGVETTKGVAPERLLVFNPGGFIIKIFFAVAVPVLTLKGAEYDGLLDRISSYAFIFLLMYALASLFGFAINVTNSYLIAIIVFVLLLIGFITVLGKAEVFLNGYGKYGTFSFQLLSFALFIWPLYRDVKKAVLRFKHTV